MSLAASTPSRARSAASGGVAGCTLEQGEVEEAVGVIDFVAGPHDVLMHGGEELAGGAQLAGPEQQLGVQHARVLPLERPAAALCAKNGPCELIAPGLSRQPFQKGEVGRSDQPQVGRPHAVGDPDGLTSALEAVAQVAAEHAAHPAELLEHAAVEWLVVTGLLQRPQQIGLAGLPFVVLEVGALEENLGTAGARRDRGHQPIGKGECSADLAGDRAVLHLRDRAPPGGLRVVGWSEAYAVTGEIRGDVERCPERGAVGRLLQQPGHGGVGLVGREGEVTSPDVGIGGLSCQTPVQRPARQRAHPLVDRGADGRVREADREVLVDDE